MFERPLNISDQSSAELEQWRARAAAAEAELEQSQIHLSILQQELQEKEVGSERGNSLDQLRNELLARIESNSGTSAPGGPSGRPSIVLNEDGRKSLLNQRELFEKLKRRFDEAQEATAKDVEPDLVIGNLDRELELEEELRKVRKEQVELNIKLASALSQRNMLITSCFVTFVGT